MEQGSRYGMTVARVLVVTIFLLKAAGVVEQGLRSAGPPSDVSQSARAVAS